MKKQKCRLCGERHGLGEGHVFRGGFKADREPLGKVKGGEREVLVKSPSVVEGVEAGPSREGKEGVTRQAEYQRRWRKANPEKHRAQQRAYRERKKGGGE